MTKNEFIDRVLGFEQFKERLKDSHVVCLLLGNVLVDNNTRIQSVLIVNIVSCEFDINKYYYLDFVSNSFIEISRVNINIISSLNNASNFDKFTSLFRFRVNTINSSVSTFGNRNAKETMLSSIFICTDINNNYVLSDDTVVCRVKLYLPATDISYSYLLSDLELITPNLDALNISKIKKDVFKIVLGNRVTVCRKNDYKLDIGIKGIVRSIDKIGVMYVCDIDINNRTYKLNPRQVRISAIDKDYVDANINNSSKYKSAVRYVAKSSNYRKVPVQNKRRERRVNTTTIEDAATIPQAEEGIIDIENTFQTVNYTWFNVRNSVDI